MWKGDEDIPELLEYVTEPRPRWERHRQALKTDSAFIVVDSLSRVCSTVWIVAHGTHVGDPDSRKVIDVERRVRRDVTRNRRVLGSTDVIIKSYGLIRADGLDTAQLRPRLVCAHGNVGFRARNRSEEFDYVVCLALVIPCNVHIERLTDRGVEWEETLCGRETLSARPSLDFTRLLWSFRTFLTRLATSV